ncbi:hypothetical protein FA13DRAFT_1796022 [Coprinellus micaceus]|uniref:F-box domain-containing protein n=2 Tax=Coprinellus micaceus TaxID=71717 RepID=A0A4Y7SVM9_COPMI|nr:hypothetical protein FA13DRAFT_1796022 [Coprinellus micaceus]
MSGAAARASQRAAIEQQRGQLMAALQYLDSCLNALSPVNALPIELLSRIFALNAAIVMEAVSGAPQRKRSLERIRIAHVCRHWREVALGSAELWSNILFTRRKIAELMLKRSNSAPLTIALRQVDTHCSLFYFMLLLTTTFPVLEKLNLRFKDPIHKANPERPDLPEGLLGGSPPALKHLEIFEFCIPKYDMLPLVPTLTHLQIGSNHSMPTRPPIKALLKALKELPLLHTLVLANYVPSDTPSQRDRQPHRVHVPPQPPYHTHLLRSYSPIDTSTSIQSTKTMWPEHYALMLDLSFSSVDGGTKPYPGMCTGFLDPHRDGLTTGLLIPFVRSSVNLTTLQSLHMEARSWGSSTAEWRMFGEILPCLQDIAFNTNTEATEFCAALKEGPSPQTGGDVPFQASTIPLFPALATISFEAHRIKELKATWDDDTFSEEDVRFFERAVPGLKVKWMQDEESEELWDSDEEGY